MPEIFCKDHKIKIIEYGKQSEQVVSVREIANDLYTAICKMVKRSK